jgi:hypothetical protein
MGTEAGQLEAHVTTPSGATILIRGAKEDVTKVLELFALPNPPTSPPARSHHGQGHASLDGIAEKDDDGNVNLVVADLKAKSAMDAAKRLIYITLLARRELLAEKKTERATVNDVLRSYNLYDGNTRGIIPSDKALVAEGRKFVSLSTAALPRAWEFVKEIHDPAVSGAWSPTVRRRRSKSKAKSME